MTKQLVAVKIFFSSQFDDAAEAEVEALSALEHPHIVKIFEWKQGLLEHPSKGNKVVNFIVLEFLPNGELFDLICLGGRLSEDCARYFFKQLLSAMGYMHGKGVTHRDLKPENLMMDAETNLKVADFGFAAPIEGYDKSGLLRSQVGSATYMAPELHLGKSYTGESVDLFAAAVILFTMVSQRPPFETATLQDGLYRYLAAERPRQFWDLHLASFAEEGDSVGYSDEFRDLFEKMMKLNHPNVLGIIH